MKKAVAATFVLAALVVICVVLINRGVTVVVHNVGNEPLHSVIVHVTGNSYPIGDIAAGSSSSVMVHATSESRVELEHGAHERLVVDCYFENGYKGTITAEVTSFKVVNVKDRVRVGQRDGAVAGRFDV